jgi:hypothetical protein
VDAERFDTVVRGLVRSAGSRRQTLRVVGAALVGGALSSRPGSSLAKPKPDKCNKDEQCPEGAACVNEECVGCAEGLTLCFDPVGLPPVGSGQYQCVNLQTNNCHCGDCENRCSGSGLGRCCANGICGDESAGHCPAPADADYCDPRDAPTVIIK